MKKFVFVLPLLAVVAVLFAFAGSKSLVGKWSATYGNGAPGKVVFRSNGTYVAEFTGQGWKVNGQYKVQGDMVSISDSICGLGYQGKYAATWYSDDSVGFKAVTDSCSGRRVTGDGLVLMREK
jgi:hypothetical protein